MSKEIPRVDSVMVNGALDCPREKRSRYFQRYSFHECLHHPITLRDGLVFCFWNNSIPGYYPLPLFPPFLPRFLLRPHPFPSITLSPSHPSRTHTHSLFLFLSYFLSIHLYLSSFFLLHLLTFIFPARSHRAKTIIV